VKTELVVITTSRDMTPRLTTGVQCSVCEGRDRGQEWLFVMVCVLILNLTLKISLILQVNPVNPVINGPRKSGHISVVAVLKLFFKEENDRLNFCLG